MYSVRTLSVFTQVILTCGCFVSDSHLAYSAVLCYRAVSFWPPDGSIYILMHCREISFKGNILCCDPFCVHRDVEHFRMMRRKCSLFHRCPAVLTYTVCTVFTIFYILGTFSLEMCLDKHATHTVLSVPCCGPQPRESLDQILCFIYLCSVVKSK